MYYAMTRGLLFKCKGLPLQKYMDLWDARSWPASAPCGKRSAGADLAHMRAHAPMQLGAPIRLAAPTPFVVQLSPCGLRNGAAPPPSSCKCGLPPSLRPLPPLIRTGGGGGGRPLQPLPRPQLRLEAEDLRLPAVLRGGGLRQELQQLLNQTRTVPGGRRSARGVRTRAGYTSARAPIDAHSPTLPDHSARCALRGPQTHTMLRRGTVALLLAGLALCQR